MEKFQLTCEWIPTTDNVNGVNMIVEYNLSLDYPLSRFHNLQTFATIRYSEPRKEWYIHWMSDFLDNTEMLYLQGTLEKLVKYVEVNLFGCYVQKTLKDNK